MVSLQEATVLGTKVREIDNYDVDRVFDQVAAEPCPVVFRGIAADWPLVRKARRSSKAAEEFLGSFYKGAPVHAFVSESDIKGRIFYTDDLANNNFTRISTQMDRVLEQLRESRETGSQATIYMGSAPIDHCLPGMAAENSLPHECIDATVRIWIGNKTTVAAHYDAMDNIACVCAGRRRFTLFPPDQLENLYVGPIDFTPAGQAVSLVDLNNPDMSRFPRFAEALEHAQTAELEAGDAVFIPSMWWHHVEGLEDFNILINHWWRQCPNFMGAPYDALLHAILNIKGLPKVQRDAWREIFDFYVFDSKEENLRHIPEERRGVVGDLDEVSARKIRAALRSKLNR